MSATVWAAFLAAAGIGACGRYLISLWLNTWSNGPHPWGTFAVNVTGCLAAGVVAGSAIHHGWSPDIVTVVAIGGLGSFTTFSTWAFETVRLAEEGDQSVALLNALTSVLACALAATAGFALASAV
jgi:fluoride exporter